MMFYQKGSDINQELFPVSNSSLPILRIMLLK